MKNIKLIKKRKILVLLVLVVITVIGIPIISLAESSYEIPNAAFKDANFYGCIIASYNDISSKDTDLTVNDNISDENLALIKTLSCSSEDINDVTGIEKLINLETVYLDRNELNNIDLSHNKAIVTLFLSKNNLKSVDVSGLTELKELYIVNNMIKDLDLSKNLKLTNLSLKYNHISEIDLTQNVNLRELLLGYNNLSSINLSNNVNLELLDLSQNRLNSIDVSKLIKLKSLYLEHNFLNNIDLTNNELLEAVDLMDNELKEINFENLFNLINVNVASNMLTNIDFTDQSKLTEIYVNYNPLKNLTVNDVNLIINESEYNQLEFKVQKVVLGPGLIMDLSNSPYELYLNEKVLVNKNISVDTFLEEIGISGLTKEVYNGDTEVTSGNVKNGYTLRISYGGVVIQELPIEVLVNPYFKDMTFYEMVIRAYNSEFGTSLTTADELTKTQLAKISEISVYYTEEGNRIDHKVGNTSGIEYLTGLNSVYLYDNIISEIDVSKNVNLESLILEDNLLTNINLSNNTKLTHLSLSYNCFEKVNLDKQTKLEYLSLTGNHFNAVKTSHMKNLEYLLLSYNKINNIDSTNNTKLTNLQLENNLINEVDLSKNVMLRTLYLVHNPIDNIDIAANYYLETLYFDGDMIVLGNDSKVNNVRFLKDSTYSSNYAVRNGIKLEPKEIIKARDYIRFAEYSDCKHGTDIENYKEAIIYIKGDITGDGLLKINDISKLYQALKGKVELNDDELFVTDFNKDGEIKINDVSKAYQRLKGMINSL